MLNTPCTVEVTANPVAWYAAIVATLSTVIGVMNYFRDRTKIVVKLSQGMYVDTRGLGDVLVFIEAVNVGRRPVTLTGAGFKLKNGKSVEILRPQGTTFPHELQEGESMRVSMNKNDLVRELTAEQTRVSNAWYRDAIGKRHKTRFSIEI